MCPTRIPHNYRHDIDTDYVVARYREGISADRIAAEYGVNSNAILSRLRKAGVERRKRTDYFKAFVPTDQVVALYRSGMSTLAVAKAIGVTKHAVLERLKVAGIKRRKLSDYDAPRGSAHHLWKGGRLIDKEGYVLVYVGPPCRRRHEHRVVMEKVLGRPLKRHEYVHHINGVRDDNRPENLVVTAPNQHEARTLIKALQRRILYLESLLRDHQKPLPCASGTSPKT